MLISFALWINITITNFDFDSATSLGDGSTKPVSPSACRMYHAASERFVRKDDMLETEKWENVWIFSNFEMGQTVMARLLGWFSPCSNVSELFWLKKGDLHNVKSVVIMLWLTDVQTNL